MNHFQAVCRSTEVKGGAVQEIEQNTAADKQVNMVNITPYTFHSILSVIIVKLKTSSSHNSAVIPYKVDTGIDGNILPFHLFKILLPKETKEELVATESSSLILKLTTKQ